MSNPRLLLFGGILLAFLVAAATLRRPAVRAAAPVKTPVEAVEADSGYSRELGGRTSRMSGISSMVSTNAPIVRTGEVTDLEFREDYEGQRERARGDSAIFGVVRSMPERAPGDFGEDVVRPRRGPFGRFGDGETSGGPGRGDWQVPSQRMRPTPIVAAKVELYENDPTTKNPPLFTADTDEEGSYTLAQLNANEARRYILVVRAPGFAPEARPIYMDGQPQRQDWMLRRGVTVSGTVRDTVTSQPVDGATVFQPSTTGDGTPYQMLGTVTSANGGQFAFTAPQGKVWISAIAPGYSSANVSVRSPNESVVLPMVPGAGTIRGTTVSRLTKKPVGQVKVVVRADSNSGPLATMLSKDDGAFEFTDLPTAEVLEVYALRGGISSIIGEVELKRGETREGLVLIVPDDLLVSGKVIRESDSAALPGVRIWFDGPRGTTSTLSDDSGRFWFQTMALETYTMKVHEKGYLPSGDDPKSTGVVETITRKLPEGASSDEVTIRLRGVPSIGGRLRSTGRNGAPGGYVWGGTVTLDYKVGQDYTRLGTSSDVNGVYFFNLPSRKQGVARVSALYRGTTAAENTKAPRRGNLDLQLKRNMSRARVLLSDGSPLSGIAVFTHHYLDPAFRVDGGAFNVDTNGNLWIPLAEKQKIDLTFAMPDDRSITKTYDTDTLIKDRYVFTYDPVAGDVTAQAQRGGGRGPGGPGGGGPGGFGGGRGPGGGAGGGGGGRR